MVLTLDLESGSKPKCWKLTHGGQNPDSKGSASQTMRDAQGFVYGLIPETWFLHLVLIWAQILTIIQVIKEFDFCIIGMKK